MSERRPPTADELRRRLKFKEAHDAPGNSAPESGGEASAAGGDGLYFFVSFDLVDSTELKQSAKSVPDWLNVVRGFYLAAVDCLVDATTAHSPPTVWKYVGDEVLAFFLVKSRPDVSLLLTATGEPLRAATLAINARGTDDQGGPDHLIKATAWLAYVRDLSEFEASGVDALRAVPDSKNLNLRIRLPSSLGDETTKLVDFIGPTIDAGFRVAKTAWPHVVAVSAELALLVSEAGGDGCADCLRIIEFTRHKGVWGGHVYPVIWYSQNWDAFADWFTLEQRLERHPRYLAAERVSTHAFARKDLCDAMSAVGRYESTRAWMDGLPNRAERDGTVSALSAPESATGGEASGSREASEP